MAASRPRARGAICSDAAGHHFIEVSRFVDPEWLVEFELDAIVPDLISLIPEVTGLATTAGRCYSGVRRYPDGGGLTAAERARREQVRLAAELIGPYRKETRFPPQ